MTDGTMSDNAMSDGANQTTLCQDAQLTSYTKPKTTEAATIRLRMEESMISSDVIRGYNDTIILYLLLGNASYGYEISKNIRKISQDKYVIKETTLYSAVSRMERNGYIKSYYDVGENGKKRKRLPD